MLVVVPEVPVPKRGLVVEVVPPKRPGLVVVTVAAPTVKLNPVDLAGWDCWFWFRFPNKFNVPLVVPVPVVEPKLNWVEVVVGGVPKRLVV